MSQVDVIVPCYGYGRYLRECVASVLTQPNVSTRVLILDDASPDETPDVGRALAGADHRVEYRRHPKNLGHIATYNAGIDWLRSDYYLLLSADDLLTPGALCRAISVMEENPQVVLTYGGAIRTADPKLEVCVPPAEFNYRVLSGAEFVAVCCACCNNMVPTPTAIVRTAVQRKLGGYRTELPYAGDLEMWLRLAAHGAIAELDVEQAYYRVHGQNMFEQYRRIDTFEQRRLAFQCFFEQYGARIAGGARLRSLANRQLAGKALWMACDALERGDKAQMCECQQHALNIYPKVRLWPAWWRLKCKQVLPARIYSVLLPAYRRVLGRR